MPPEVPLEEPLDVPLEPPDEPPPLDVLPPGALLSEQAARRRAKPRKLWSRIDSLDGVCHILVCSPNGRHAELIRTTRALLASFGSVHEKSDYGTGSQT